MSAPEGVVHTSEIAKRLGLADGWIESRTGVRERRIAGSGDRLASSATAAGRQALRNAGLEPDDIDLLLVATFTADDVLPNTAALVARDLGAPRASAHDIGAACTGFISGLAAAASAIESGRAVHVLLIAADYMSRTIDGTDRRTAGLMGDGAGAVVLSGGDDDETYIGPVVLHTDPAGPELVFSGWDDRILHMVGPEVFRRAVDRISEASVEAVGRAGITLDDIDVFVYHQANSRILQGVGKRLELDTDKVVNCVPEYGNTGAASIPIGLCVAEEQGLLKNGSTVLFGAIGAGFIYGACVVRWVGP